MIYPAWNDDSVYTVLPFPFLPLPFDEFWGAAAAVLSLVGGSILLELLLPFQRLLGGGLEPKIFLSELFPLMGGFSRIFVAVGSSGNMELLILGGVARGPGAGRETEKGREELAPSDGNATAGAGATIDGLFGFQVGAWEPGTTLGAGPAFACKEGNAFRGVLPFAGGCPAAWATRSHTRREDWLLDLALDVCLMLSNLPEAIPA